MSPTAAGRAWSVAQVLVAVAMAGSIFYLVTGLAWWWVLNVGAAAIALGGAAVPAWRTPASLASTIVYVPFNAFVFLVNLPELVPVLVAFGLLVPVAQVTLTVLAWRANPFKAA